MNSESPRISVRLAEAIPELGIQAGAVVSFDPGDRHALGVLVTYQLPPTVLPILAQKVPAFRAVQAPGQSAPTGGRSNGMLRLIRESAFGDGSPYTDWELLVDAPSVPANRDPATGPRHAQAGDLLREQPGDELTPFQLRRNGVQIGHPEWWQVRHLFEGLRGHPGDQGSDSDLLDQLLTRRPEGVALATADIPGTVVRKGDLLVIGLGRSLLRPVTRAVQVPRRQFKAIADAFGKGRPLQFVTPPRGHLRPWDYLRHPSALRGQDSTSRAFVLRRVAPSTVRPVPAQSDLGAIFELLSEVGCRPG